VIAALRNIERTPIPLGIDQAITIGPLSPQRLRVRLLHVRRVLAPQRGQARHHASAQRSPAGTADTDCAAVVATPAGDSNELLGWAIGMRGALLYAYVRFPYRRSKLGFHRLGTASLAP